MEPVIVISGDGHIGAHVEGYTEYLDAKYRHLVPELVADEKDHVRLRDVFNLNDPDRLEAMDENNRLRTGGLAGGWDVGRRLQEMDAEGVAAEVVYPGTAEAMTPFFYQFNRPCSEELRMAGTRAYHRWLADAIEPSKGRIIGTAVPGPSANLTETLDELSFVAKRGFRAVFVPGQIPSAALPPILDPFYEPFWAACNDLGLVLTVHVGYGQEQGILTKLVAEVLKVQRQAAEAGRDAKGFEDAMLEVMSKLDEQNPESVFAQDLGPRQKIWQLIFSGVFDRYPNLKVTIAECRGDWVPATKAHMDKRFLAAKRRPNLKMKPSEYFGKNVFVCPTSPRRSEVEMRHEIGLDTFVFGVDYPHPEGTWPNTPTWLRATFFDVPEQELRAMLGGNAIHLYGLDQQWLAEIAAKIGPKPGDIVGHHKLDERVIQDFVMRSGFKNTSRIFEPALIDSKVDADLAATAA